MNDTFEIRGEDLDSTMTRRGEALLSTLRTICEVDADTRVNVWAFRDELGGVGISEVALVKGNGGSSWMHSDLDAAPVIFFCQWYLTVCLEDMQVQGGRVVEDPEQEARRGIAYAIQGDMPEWEERTVNPWRIEA